MLIKGLKSLVLLLGYPFLILMAGVHDCIRLMLSIVCVLPHVMLWGRSHYTHFWFAQSTIQSMHAKWQQVWLGNSETVWAGNVTSTDPKGMQAGRVKKELYIPTTEGSVALSQLPMLITAEPPVDPVTASDKLRKQQPPSKLVETREGAEGVLSPQGKEQRQQAAVSDTVGQPLYNTPQIQSIERDNIPNRASLNSLYKSPSRDSPEKKVQPSFGSEAILPTPRIKQSSAVKKAEPIAVYNDQESKLSNCVSSEEGIARHREDYRWRFGNVSVEEVKREKYLLSERKKLIQKGEEATLEGYESYRIRSDIVDTQVKGLVKSPGKKGSRENTGTQERGRGDAEYGDRRETPIMGG